MSSIPYMDHRESQKVYDNFKQFEFSPAKHDSLPIISEI